MIPPKSKSRLGRGLSSLIPQATVTADVVTAKSVSPQPPTAAGSVTVAAGQPAEIPIGLVIPNPSQPRRAIDPERLAELAASMRSTGIIQPIIVRTTGEQYELIAGERRWRAAQLAGLRTVPAIIRDVDAYAQAQMALVENIQRQDLNPIDRALAYQTLVKQLGLTQAELAQRLGEDRSSIANYLRLLDLADAVRNQVIDGKLSLGHAKILAGVSPAEEQERLADLIVAQDLSVRNLERLVADEGGDIKPARAETKQTAYLSDLEKTLSRQLGLKVDVQSKAKGKGKLILHYGSLDQFDQLLKTLGVNIESD